MTSLTAVWRCTSVSGLHSCGMLWPVNNRNCSGRCIGYRTLGCLLNASAEVRSAHGSLTWPKTWPPQFTMSSLRRQTFALSLEPWVTSTSFMFLLGMKKWCRSCGGSDGAKAHLSLLLGKIQPLSEVLWRLPFILH